MSEKKGAKSPLRTAKRLVGYITRDYKASFAAVCVSIIISAAANVAGSLFIQILIDDYIVPLLSVDYPEFSGLFRAVCTMAGIYLLGVLTTFIYNLLMVNIAQGVLKAIRDEMFSHMQKFPISYFDSHSHGDTMSRYTNDTDTLRQFIAISIPQAFSSLVTIVVVLCAMLYLSPLLTIVVVLMMLAMVRISTVIGGKSSKYFFEQQSALGKVNGFIEEMIQGQKVVNVFCHEEAAKVDFDRLNEELCECATTANSQAITLMPILINMGNLTYVLTAIAGGLFAVSGIGGLTLGAIVSFLQMVRSTVGPISQIAQQLNAIVMALAGAERIFELIAEEVECDDGCVELVNVKFEGEKPVETTERTNIWAWKRPTGDNKAEYTILSGDVRFRNVSFSYKENEPILHDISLYARPGEKLAFVGATGAGKTTITNLINRFYDIQSGTITYDGIDIRDIKKADLRRSLGIVLQDVNLFTGTIRENIRYGRLGASDEEVYAAAALANAHRFIERLPQGYDTQLGGGGTGATRRAAGRGRAEDADEDKVGTDLSQGQRQLISIARAAVADPPVMIMDEATSSIDTRTEMIVQRGMDGLMFDRTVFVIAHRLSTVRNSDAIIVLDQGHIIERGSHDELIELRGKYYQLYTGAFELE